MDILVVLGVIILSVWIANKVAPKPTLEAKKPIPCPPHKWTDKGKEDGQEYMVCEVCGQLPGE